MKAEYAAAYRGLYERHWWWRAREALLVREIAEHQPPAGWKSVLDIGCGDGLFFDQLARFGEVWGVESDGSLIRPDSPYRARIHVGPFDASFIPGRRFGLVLMLDVLEHLADPAAALAQVRRLLEAGGRLLVTVPAFQLLWTHHDDMNQHLRRYRKQSLRTVVEQGGLRMLASRYCFHWLFPVKLAVRAVERVPGGNGAPATVPPGWLNRLLFRVSRFEQDTLGRFDLPFGSSLLAWCGAT